MRFSGLTIFFLLTVSVLYGQKPTNLDEAVRQLTTIHHDTTKQQIIAMTEREFISNSHFGVGMWIRNNWGLWGGGQLADYFNSLGIQHPDDMSSIILTCYYRQLTNKEWELEKQVAFYQAYWKATTDHFERLKTDTAYQREIKIKQDSMKSAKLNRKKKEWTAGKKVSGYVDQRCDFLNDFVLRTKVEGTIIEWTDDKLVIQITKYYDENKKKRITKCHNIIDDRLTVPDHDLFILEQ